MSDTKNNFSWDRFPGDQTVYAGTDAIVYLNYGSDLYHLGNCSTVSYSVHREKYPVRRLGHSHPVGVSRGTRTIAGSFVFINFAASALGHFLSRFSIDGKDVVLADQLPPFDIVMVFINEAGNISYLKLHGVEILDEGGVFGTNEAYTETTMQYIARDATLLKPEGKAVNSAIIAKIESQLSTGVYTEHDTPTDNVSFTWGNPEEQNE